MTRWNDFIGLWELIKEAIESEPWYENEVVLNFPSFEMARFARVIIGKGKLQIIEGIPCITIIFPKQRRQTV